MRKGVKHGLSVEYSGGGYGYYCTSVHKNGEEEFFLRLDYNGSEDERRDKNEKFGDLNGSYFLA